MLSEPILIIQNEHTFQPSLLKQLRGCPTGCVNTKALVQARCKAYVSLPKASHPKILKGAPDGEKSILRFGPDTPTVCGFANDSVARDELRMRAE
eukprot:scaffold371021_cov18-Prasinocladus_malaysianus.AAC.1